MEWHGPNHPFITWAATYLWLISIFSITWSLILIFCLSDLLYLTGTDIVNAIVLLSGLVMLPTNIFILNNIAKGKKLDVRLRVLCCPLWQCMLWIAIINFIGVILCMHKIYICQDIVTNFFSKSMKNYRVLSKYKRFVDDIQLSLQCCGLKSYKDWFKYDWHDKVRDYELEPLADNTGLKTVKIDFDSVPLSCCKSGSCVASYLEELGTNSINTDGCGNIMYRLIVISMNIHLVVFVSVILLQIFIFRCIVMNSSETRTQKFINHIMPVNERFEMSSDSYRLNVEDSDEEHEQ